MRHTAIMALMGLVASTMLSAKALAEDKLFQYDGKSYSTKDLEPKYQSQYYEFANQFYLQKEQLADEVLLNLYFEAQGKKSKKSVEDLRAEAFKVKDPSEKELKAFYEENKKRIPYPYDQVKSEIERFVKQQKMAEKRDELLKTVKKAGKYQFLAQKPVAPVVKLNLDGFVERGNLKSKVTVVEFADFKCPHCGEAEAAFKKLYKKYDDKVHFVYVDFPIISDLSIKLAEGAFCARKQNKYWEYHGMAFEQQAKTTADSPKQFAKELGLDEKAFAACYDKGEGKAIVDKGKAEGQRVGVSGTPTIYINGKKIVVGLTEQDLSKAIDEALKDTKNAS